MDRRLLSRNIDPEESRRRRSGIGRGGFPWTVPHKKHCSSRRHVVVLPDYRMGGRTKASYKMRKTVGMILSGEKWDETKPGIAVC